VSDRYAGGSRTALAVVDQDDMRAIGPSIDNLVRACQWVVAVDRIRADILGVVAHLIAAESDFSHGSIVP
jgi:hypothetical protein